MNLLSFTYEAWTMQPQVFKLPLVFMYIDLGTGSMLLQMLIAGLLSVAITFKRVRLYVMAFFRRGAPDKAITPEAAPGPTDTK